MTTLEKVVVVTRKTRLVELIERFNTRAQAKFYIEHAGGDFGEYEREDAAYRRALDRVRRAVEVGLKVQVLDRDLVPTYTFLPTDAVVTLGQDGLVANTAKYAAGQPIIGVNPDPERFDGVLLPFLPEQVDAALERVLHGRHRVRAVTLAEARLGDGQRLLAFNDLFVGAQSHVSARYMIQRGATREAQSSSGVLVSTGAGSTGWISSVFNMAAGVTSLGGGKAGNALRLRWDDRRLLFAVREPFVSRHSTATVVAGVLDADESMIMESTMPTGGVIFSDGIESDFLRFDAGAVASIGASRDYASLVVPGNGAER